MSMHLPWRTIAVSAVLLFLASPSTVNAAYTSVVAGTTAAMTGDAAGDTLIITQSGGLFSHNRFTAGDPGFNSAIDFDTTVAGDQTVPSTTGIININAGDGNDTIALGDGVNVRGAIDGGVGTDTLDFSASTTAVGANLGLGTTGLSATLGADQENPPTTHAATATATVTNYNIVSHTFDITVTVTGLLPADVTGFHIHQGAVGVNGPIIVDFTGLAPLVPAGTGFTFTANGLVLPAVNEAAFLGGGTYVNIHTATFPGGAIRGQLFSGGNVNLASGTATGAVTLTNIENVTGGAGNDSLVGSFAVNTITGGAGADWIVGGPGNDTLNGGAGADVLVWSNGDGTDIDEGGTESDIVQVNGSTAAADNFLVSANGARLRFDRTNLGLFSLDIGTVETLIVNGIGGADIFNVNDLTGVATLTTLNLRGFDGDDSFTLVPTSSGAVAFNVHGGPGSDMLIGPNGGATWNVTSANQGNIDGLVRAFSFIETLVGGSGTDSFYVKAFATGTATSVTGGAGTDTLFYNAEGRAVSGDASLPDGAIVSPGVQSVAFSQFEAVNIVNPPATLVQVTPGAGQPGQANLVVSLLGQLTHFVQGQTAANFGVGVTVNSLTVQSATQATASITIAANAAPGPRTVTLTTGTEVAMGSGAFLVIPFPLTTGDFNADGRSEIAVFRPSNGAWFIQGATSVPMFGGQGDVPVARDYDGDGITDIAVFRPGVSTWFIFLSRTQTFASYIFGGVGDIPVPEDYDGDGMADIALFRPSTGTWFIVESSSGTLFTSPFGGPGDIPVPADYDGDHKADIAIFRPSNGTWYIFLSDTQTFVSFTWGSVGDIPVPQDYDGDGLSDIAVFRPGTGVWYIVQSSTFTSITYTWGGASDIPVPTDYDGDGLADIAVFRPSASSWFIWLSATQTGFSTLWGGVGDIPVVKRP